MYMSEHNERINTKKAENISLSSQFVINNELKTHIFSLILNLYKCPQFVLPYNPPIKR